MKKLTFEPGRSKHYCAFGLDIQSEIDLPAPEVDRADDEGPSVTVRVGAVDRLAIDGEEGLRYRAGRGRLALEVDNVASYLIEGGATITVAPCPTADAGAVRLFLAGAVFRALLLQREMLALRASSVVLPNGHAVAFMGVSGAGKSTLAYAFSRKGCAFLTDEVCAVDVLSGDGCRVARGFRNVNLWPDALAALGMEAKKFRPIRKGLRKRVVPLAPAAGIASVPLRKIYVLRGLPVSEVKISRVHPLDAFSTLQASMSANSWVKAMGVQPSLLQLSQVLSMKVSFVFVDSPRKKNWSQQLMEKLEADFGAL